MRHVSRTHRVVLDRLFDRINLDPKIQIKYVDTKNQLADILTKRSFTRDEWNHLLHLLNIMDLSMFSCSHFFLSNRKQTVQSAMSKRRSSEETGSPTAKPKPRSTNLETMKTRSISLARREARMSSYCSSQEKSDSENPGDVEVGKDRAGKSIWKQMASTSPYPAEESQVWKLESTQESKGEDF